MWTVCPGALQIDLLRAVRSSGSPPPPGHRAPRAGSVCAHVSLLLCCPFTLWAKWGVSVREMQEPRAREVGGRATSGSVPLPP